MGDLLKRVRFLYKIVFYLLIWIDVSLVNSGISDDMLRRKAVKDQILNGYDKTIRPTKEGSNTTEVDSMLMPRQIIEIDEEKGLFVLDSYFYMSWEDSRLRWNSSSDYKSYKQMPPDLLWVPDISVYNSHTLQVDPTQQVYLLVMSNGRVLWVPPILTKTSCSLISEIAYPNGKVTCFVRLGSWMHDGWEIDFFHDNHIILDMFLNHHPRWELLASEVKFVRDDTIHEEHGERYISLIFFFPMKRRSLAEIESTRSPCILIMLLTLSIFWLPPNSSKKVLLGGFLFVALTAMLVYVAYSTKYPLGALFAVSFLQSTMYILVTTITLQILIIFKLCNLSGPARPHPAIMQLLNSSLAKFACLRSPFSNDNLPVDRIQLKEEDSSNSEDSAPTVKQDWMLFATALDRVFFVFMSITVVVVHLL